MPDLVPVDHDPFSTFVPVDHDPFAVNPDAALAASMTHWPEAPNPAAPYVQGTKDFLKGGLSEVLKGQGVQLPEWSNRVGDVLQSEAANAAIGMTTPLKGMKGITAYHGSPHDFDKFDLSRIGTGEGAQAYGHGLYFAESPKTAEFYKAQLTQTKWPALVMDKASSGKGWSVYDHSAGPPGQPKELATFPTKDAAMAHVDELLDAAEKAKNPGKMYQVSIKADPEHFLDWDKSLSEQHPEVIRKLEDAYPGMVEQGRSVQQSLFPYGQKPQITEALRAAGIPGIKYLDQGSRITGGVDKLGDQYFVKGSMKPYATRAEAEAAAEASGGKTRNFVVFDDKLIDIMKKYGLAGLMAGGAYHFKTQQVDHDPFERQ